MKDVTNVQRRLFEVLQTTIFTQLLVISRSIVPRCRPRSRMASGLLKNVIFAVFEYYLVVLINAKFKLISF